jgi:ligand-binding sensor domain-containing protein/signal transduction histidine kinase
VNRIVRDARGFLWFCTADGLSRFDGYSFTNFGTDQGLPDPNVSDFLEARSGELWLATGGGLICFNPKGEANTITGANDRRLVPAMFTIVSSNFDDRPAPAINVLLEDHNGLIWCGTNRGLYCVDQTSGTSVLRRVDIGIPDQYAEQSFVLALAEDHAGHLWIAAPSGLYRRWPDGTTARYTVRNGLPEDYIQTLLADDKSRLWVGTRSTGFFEVVAKPESTPLVVAHDYTVKNGLPTGWVFQLFEGSDRRFWAATNAGVIEFFPDDNDHRPRFRTYTTSNGLSYHEITALCEDLAGNLWLGTAAAGAAKLSHNGFVTYTSGDGIATANAIFGDSSGGVCIRGSAPGDNTAAGLSRGGSNPRGAPQDVFVRRFGRFDGEQFNWFKPDALSVFGWVSEQLTLQSRNGEWWIGTGDGLYRFPAFANFSQLKAARPSAIYTTKDGLAAEQVYRIFEDSQGDIWISTTSSVTNGLARWEPATGKLRDLAPGLQIHANDLAHSFAEDRSGNVWIGFNSGIARYRDGNVRFFPRGDDLPGAIVNIYPDLSGRVWFASSRGGLIRVDDPGPDQPTFIRYTTAQGLSSNDTEVITEDIEGRIYVGGGRGLDQLDPATGLVRHFTTADGLAAGAFLAAFRDRDGNLWFGTTRGLSRFRPAPDKDVSSSPIMIVGLQVAGERRIVSAMGESDIQLSDLAADKNQVQIDFTGLSFKPGEVLRYQYKLEGADTDWRAPTELRSVTFANLSPGHYRFYVRAANSEGASSLSPAVVSFTILPPLWRRWWFIALAILGAAAIIYSLYRYRVARLLELTNMRTRIATDLHDDIGANLTRIALLSEVAKQQLGASETREDSPLLSIARIARESVGSMGDIVWAINPHRESLLDLTRRMRQHADEVFTLRDINLRFNAPSANEDLRLGVDVRRDLLLIFKEAVNNAARHSKCTEVEIDFRVEGSVLSLRIIDNGVGFDPSIESQGQGLRSMKRRATVLGGALEINSHSRRGGTVVGVILPLSRTPRL